MAQRLVVYLDMDTTLVDFPSAFSRVPHTMLESHPERDEIPGTFALMDPVEGADPVGVRWPPRTPCSSTDPRR